MKRALVLASEPIYNLGGEFVANIHDEWQIESPKENSDAIGTAAVNAIREAGRYYRFACPLDAQYSTGETWADTH